LKIQGSAVLVTGANGGIGRALVGELLCRGASKVYVCGRSEAALVPLLAGEDSRLVPVILDVTDPVQIEKAAKRASDVTLVINNAGYSAEQGTLAREAIANARREIEVNYIGPLGVARSFASVITAAGGGAIINVLSFLSLVTLPLMGTYSASKAAALAMTRSLRAELAAQGIAVVAAMPVQVDTAMGDWWNGPKVAPEDVARDVLDALEAEEEEIFPGELSRGAAETFRKDPKALQAQHSSVLPAA
jgi:short-subunit dehydrogenase